MGGQGGRRVAARIPDGIQFLSHLIIAGSGRPENAPRWNNRASNQRTENYIGDWSERWSGCSTATRVSPISLTVRRPQARFYPVVEA
jgi:hypothetical protein